MRSFRVFFGVVLLAGICASFAFGQAKPQPRQPEPNQPARESGKPVPGSNDHAVKVHGHWLIEIRNPDGSLASRHEIENTLTGGGTPLANLLSGQAVFGGWVVSIKMNDCVNSSGVCGYMSIAQSQGVCTRLPSLGQPWNPDTSASCSTNLTVSENTGGNAVLYGTSKPAGANGGADLFLTNVASYILTCSPGVTASACLSGTSWTPSEFTDAYLGTNSNGIQILPGQTITVTVTFTFS